MLYSRLQTVVLAVAVHKNSPGAKIYPKEPAEQPTDNAVQTVANAKIKLDIAKGQRPKHALLLLVCTFHAYRQ